MPRRTSTRKNIVTEKMPRRTSSRKNKGPNDDPVVLLDRDPVIEEELGQKCKLSTDSASCFLCTSPNIAPQSAPTPHGNNIYTEEVTTFKRIFMTPPFRRKISPPAYNHFTNNEQSCVSCAKFVRNVVALEDEVVAIGRRLREKLEEGRENLVKRWKGTGTPEPVRNHVTKVKDEPDDDELVPFYEPDFDHDDESEFNFGQPTVSDALATRKSPRARKRMKNEDFVSDEDGDDSGEESNYAPDGDEGDDKEKVKRRRRRRQPPAPRRDGDDLSCAKCGKKFGYRRGLLRHEVEVCRVARSDVTLHPCQICDRVYVSKQMMMRHANTHTGNRKVSNKRIKTESESENSDSEEHEVTRIRDRDPVKRTCTVCKKMFETQLRRIWHEIKFCHVTFTPDQLEEMGVAMYPCQGDECEKVFIYKRDLNRHAKAKNHPVAEKVQPSSSDYKKFATLFSEAQKNCDDNLNSEVAKPYSLGTHACQKCGKVFATLMSKVYHEIKICKVEYDDEYLKKIKLSFLPCDRCDQKFHYQKDLDKHALTHSSVKYTCSSCGKNFRHLESFNIHVAIRCTQPTMKMTPKEQELLTKTKTKKCPQCPARLCNNSGLYRHIATVHNPAKRKPKPNPGRIEQTTVCEFCGKSFSAQVYRQHIRRMHTNVRSHVCSSCKKRFLSRDELDAHIQVCLQDEDGEEGVDKKWSCDECEATFEWPSGLNDHVNMVHLNVTRYECDLCGDRFFKLGSLNKHVKRHETTKMDKLPKRKRGKRKSRGVSSPVKKPRGRGTRGKKKSQRAEEVVFQDVIFEVSNEVEIM